MGRVVSHSVVSWVALSLLALIPWLVSHFVIGGGGPDDTHITFYVARELATTGHYVNYNGESVEQSSSMGQIGKTKRLSARFATRHNI